MEEKIATLSELIYYNAENGYTVAVFVEAGGGSFTGTGCIPQAAPGRAFRLTGAPKVHPVYGEQFAFSEYEEQMPETGKGIELFLASGVIKGVGPKLAPLIVGAFGEDALRVIAEEPNRLTALPGVGSKKAARMSDSLREHREFAEIALRFKRLDISTSAAMKLYTLYGAAAPSVVEENPYRLMDDVSGIGFRAADRIAMKLGFDRAGAARLRGGVKHILGYYVSEGNTYLPQSVLTDEAAELLETGREETEAVLTAMAADGDIRIEAPEGRRVVFPEAYCVAERSVCGDLLRLMRTAPKPIRADAGELIAMTEAEMGISLAPTQRRAVEESIENGVFVITGGPGAGKTTIIRFIIRILQHGGLKTGIAAPTGRAAKRVTEATGHEASTIHRMLEYAYSEQEDVMRFGKTAENPLAYDAVIVDEASMIDILLMKGLLRAIPSGTRLIVVGDADQLPSVGAGNVLRDMIDSEIVNAIRLTEIFRQARESLIVVNAHRINRGEYPECNGRGNDFFFLQRDGDERILETLKELCARRLPEYYTDCDILRDLQVLTPVRKGLLGSVNLNVAFQAILNPPGPERAERRFGDRILRVGDKVMQIKNNYRLEWRTPDAEGEGVFNGDIGFIRSIDAEYGRLTVVFDEERRAEYEFSQIEELEHAYAVTVHKSQGSEFPLVLMPVTRFPPILATRNLLYTAVTRGRRAVILVGSVGRLNAMVDNDQIKERYSGLRARLRAFLPGSGGETEDLWQLPK